MSKFLVHFEQNSLSRLLALLLVHLEHQVSLDPRHLGHEPLVDAEKVVTVVGAEPEERDDVSGRGRCSRFVKGQVQIAEACLKHGSPLRKLI